MIDLQTAPAPNGWNLSVALKSCSVEAVTRFIRDRDAAIIL
jgi:hypothetical protein